MSQPESSGLGFSPDSKPRPGFGLGHRPKLTQENTLSYNFSLKFLINNTVSLAYRSLLVHMKLLRLQPTQSNRSALTLGYSRRMMIKLGGEGGI